MLILTKSSLEKEQALDKIKKGSTNFEIHTIDKEFDTLYTDLSNKINVIRELGMNIYVIHSPMNCGCDVDNLTKPNKRLEDVFFMTNEIGKLQNRTILLVLHLNYNIDVFHDLNVIDKIILNLNKLLEDYPHVNVAVENLMLIGLDGDNFKFRMNSKFEAVNFVEYFNKKTGKKIGTVLDTCHMLATIELLENYRDIVKEDNIPTINEYIEKFTPTLKLIHLSYSKLLGMGKNQGILFENNYEYLVLKNIVGLLDKSGYDDLITLEIAEDNYLDTKNWIITKKNLLKAADELNIRHKFQ